MVETMLVGTAIAVAICTFSSPSEPEEQSYNPWAISIPESETKNEPIIPYLAMRPSSSDVKEMIDDLVAQDVNQVDAELQLCSDALRDEETPASFESALVAFSILVHARKLDGYFRPAVFACSKGKIEVVFETENLRLSLIVDGANRKVRSVRYDVETDMLEGKDFPDVPIALGEELQWILNSSVRELCSV